MIYVTGDTHGGIDIAKLSFKDFPEQRKLTKDDYVIVCGDFGFVWDGSKEEQWWLKWLQDKSFTTLWIDGNHENFDRLYEYPVTSKFGGKVREIVPGVYHINRGQVLTIDGRKIFFMGGARSVDKGFRREHVSWWAEELPSVAEEQAALKALDACDWEVDYVITHCAPNSVAGQLVPFGHFEEDSATKLLEHIDHLLNYKKWYCGHYHVDLVVDEHHEALYNKVVLME